jgi:hypothetical protein
LLSIYNAALGVYIFHFPFPCFTIVELYANNVNGYWGNGKKKERGLFEYQLGNSGDNNGRWKEKPMTWMVSPR